MATKRSALVDRLGLWWRLIANSRTAVATPFALLGVYDLVRPENRGWFDVSEVIPPLAAVTIALLLILAGVLEAAYKRVSGLERRLTPNIKLRPFDKTCFSETNLGNDESDDSIYVSVWPVPANEEAVKDCVAYLNAVFKDDGTGNYILTKFDDRQILEWGVSGFRPVTLDGVSNQRLNVFSVRRISPRIEPKVEHPRLNKISHVFDNNRDKFRFDLVITASNCPVHRASLFIELGDAWNDIRVRQEDSP